MEPSAGIEKIHYDLMMRSQYWPADEMQAYQREQLTKLLNHARAYVPFYKNRLDTVFNHDGSINWNRWRDIPILKRQDLIDHREAMQATHMLPEYGKVATFSSSGTTGVPVTTTHNALASWANRAAINRAYNWHKIDWNKNVCELWLFNNPKEAPWPDGKLLGHWGPAWESTQQGKFWQIERSTPLNLIIQFLEHKKISYLAARPKAAQTLALAAKRLGKNIKLDAIITVGAVAGQEDRDASKEVFGAKLVSAYNSKEGHKMASQCPSGVHYHQNSEVSRVEILNHNDEPCKEGEIGRVVVTPFFSFAQPLIRYEQGDLAEVGAACSCGRSLPVISRIVGRTAHMFCFPNGVKIAPIVPSPCREALKAVAWQIAQTSPTAVEVRYYATEEATEEVKRYVNEQIVKNMYYDVQVTFKLMDQVPLDIKGKFLEYVCELPVEERN